MVKVRVGEQQEVNLPGLISERLHVAITIAGRTLVQATVNQKPARSALYKVTGSGHFAGRPEELNSIAHTPIIAGLFASC